MPTLAQLRAQSGPRPLPRAERLVTMIEGQHLLAESEALRDELADLLLNVTRSDADGNPTGKPRKQGERGLPPRAKEIQESQRELLERLAEFQGVVTLRGMDGGSWQRYKDDHPPRDGNVADARYAGGHCNSSDLFADLGLFVAAWDEEPVAGSDWDDTLAERITYADRRDLVTAVVEMHETGVARAPKSRTVSLSTESSATA